MALDYKAAGVDIDAGDKLVKRIAPLAASTHNANVLAGLGGFGGLFQLPSDYQAPVLVSGTDGVGTKLKLALRLNQHSGLGIDLVAMCVNDIIVTGAKPLFFLDYYATGKLDIDIAETVIASIVDGCKQADCALLGGETAEMPGMYPGSEYDLAGFAVGIVERSQLITAEKVSPGDKLLGLASSGPHSNGYSLIRKVLETTHADLHQPIPGSSSELSLGETLLAPTRIYVKPLLALLEQTEVHALAHITGGGLSENLPRVLPEQTCAEIAPSTWQRPLVFDWLAQQGQIDEQEMLRTFNCGIGMVICLAAEQVEKAKTILENYGEQVFEIGQIVAQTNTNPVVKYL